MMSAQADLSSDAEQGNTGLPKGWEWKRLGDVSRTTSGGTPSRKVAEYFEGDIPWVKSGELPDGNVAEIAEYITEEAVKNSSAKLFPAGTLLIALYGATVGKLGVLTQDATTNQAVCAIFPHDDLDPMYLFWYLRYARSELIGQAVGGAQPNISQGILRDLQVPVAPYEQQGRIVAEIEKQFSRLDEAVANLKRVKANLKRYKAAVLKAAVEGKLTVAAVDGGSFDEGQWRSVGSVLLSIDQGWSPRCEKNPVAAVGDWGVIKTTAVQEFRFAQIENKELPSALEPRPNLEIKAGDLLITRAGPRKRVGVSCLVRSTQPGLMICDKVYRLRCDTSKIRPGYLELVLNAPQVLGKLNELKTGISDSGVNLTQKRFRGLAIPVPSLSTQALIEAEVERIVSTCEAIDGMCEAGLARSDRLRKAILTSLFQGGQNGKV